MSTVTPLLQIPAERPGDRIRRARKAAGLDMRELAARIQISHSRIGQWENHQDDPPEDSPIYDRIAAACGVPAAWLRTGDASWRWSTQRRRAERRRAERRGSAPWVAGQQREPVIHRTAA